MIKFKWYSLFMLFIIFGCDSNEIKVNNDVEYEITGITPLRARIGDTITIKGNNLDKLSHFFIRHGEGAPFEYQIKYDQPQPNGATEIRLKIPKLFYENASIDFPFNVSFELKLIGLIPLRKDFQNLLQLQIIDDNTAYILSEDEIYKSTDGFYTWTSVIELGDNFDGSFFFIDENNGWITANENGSMNIYYTPDGGNTMSLKHQLENSGGNFIRKIRYTSLSKGFFVTNKQEMYISQNDSFENIYDFYPNLSSSNIGETEIWDFKEINDDLIFLTPSSEPYLIKNDNQNVTLTEFDVWPSPPYFFGNTGYVQVNSDIYKSLDLGNSWSKIKTFENRTPELYFISAQEGFAFVNNFPNEIYITKDSGLTWVKYSEYDGSPYRDFTLQRGLIGGGNGQMSKYIRE